VHLPAAMKAILRCCLPGLAALGLLLGAALPVDAQTPPPTLPASSVWGRLGVGSGPGQAIPFATLLAQLNGVSAVLVGPATTVSGDLVTWTSTVGLTVGDSGVALTGTGTIALGTAGGLSITSGKTLTDTSAVGANILLGATGGGFAAWGGATACSVAIKSITAGGTPTCSTAKGTGQKSVASPTAPNSTSAFTMQGLAGAITPTASGNVLITISGTILTTNGTIAFGISYQISYGTGSAPTTNAALAGTQAGTVQTFTAPVAVTAADVAQPFSTTVVVTGLTAGTTYWIDLAAKALGAASAYSFSAVSVTPVEL
jgi:hypothetical protein